jgi:hypothetical protein
VLAVLLAIRAGGAGAASDRPDQEAKTLAGVTLPPAIEVEAQELVLNGAALRKIALIKIYVAGLYLEEKESEPGAILAADRPRTLMMHFLHDVDAKRLCEGWDTSLSENTPDPSPELVARFRTLCGWMEDAENGERSKFI